MIRQSAPARTARITSSPWFSVAVLAGCYFAVTAYLGVVLHYDFMQSDVLGYWLDSLQWQQPFNGFHVPGYPLAIALVWRATLTMLPALAVMMSINLAAYLLAALFLYRLLCDAGVEGEFATLGALLFGLWPLVGVPYVAEPRADMFAMCLLLVGLYLLQRSHANLAALPFGLALVVHKAIWPFVALTVFIYVAGRKEHLSWRAFRFAGMVAAPLFALWILGAIHHGSLSWMLVENTRVQVLSGGRLIPLDGLLGTLLAGGMKNTIKGAVLAAFAALSVFLIWSGLFHGTVRDTIHSDYGVAIPGAVLILFVFLNQFEIWAAVRFSRLLVVPLIPWASMTLRRQGWIITPRMRLATVAGMLTLVLSQFVYAWYMAGARLG